MLFTTRPKKIPPLKKKKSAQLLSNYSAGKIRRGPIRARIRSRERAGLFPKTVGERTLSAPVLRKPILVSGYRDECEAAVCLGKAGSLSRSSRRHGALLQRGLHRLCRPLLGESVCRLRVRQRGAIFKQKKWLRFSNLRMPVTSR